MSKQDRQIYENARDLVLAAFIQILKNRVPTDRAMLAELRSYLAKFRGIHGDVRRVIDKYEKPSRTTANFTEVDQAAEDSALSLIEGLEFGQTHIIHPHFDFDEDLIRAMLNNQPDPDPDNEVTTEELMNAAKNSLAIGNLIPGSISETPAPAKRGRKAKDPIEAATENIKAKAPKKCC